VRSGNNERRELFTERRFRPTILAADTPVSPEAVELEIIKSCSYAPTLGAKPINLHFKPVLAAMRKTKEICWRVCLDFHY